MGDFGRAQPTRLLSPTADSLPPVFRWSLQIRKVWSSEQEAICQHSSWAYAEAKCIFPDYTLKQQNTKPITGRGWKPCRKPCLPWRNLLGTMQQMSLPHYALEVSWEDVEDQRSKVKKDKYLTILKWGQIKNIIKDPLPSICMHVYHLTHWPKTDHLGW